MVTCCPHRGWIRSVIVAFEHPEVRVAAFCLVLRRNHASQAIANLTVAMVSRRMSPLVCFAAKTALAASHAR
jgi:hypothetical protein